MCLSGYKFYICFSYFMEVLGIAKNNDNMCFLKFSDDYGTIEAVMFSDALLKITNLDKNKVYKVNAKVEKREESYQLIVYGMFQI